MVKAEIGVAAEKTPDAAAPDTPLANDRRTAILNCADEVFLEKGFQGASMSLIAARLGGSKGTLYNYFSSKEELFLASVTRHCAKLRELMSKIADEHKSVPLTLYSVGRNYLEVVFSEDVVRKFRMIVGEATRTPELGQAFFETTSGRGAKILADYLDAVREEGLLDFDNSTRAARHFMSLCDSQFAKARWCAAIDAPSAEAMDLEVKAAVRVFLAAYGTPALKAG